jgi:hypothetical protein
VLRIVTRAARSGFASELKRRTVPRIVAMRCSLSVARSRERFFTSSSACWAWEVRE